MKNPLLLFLFCFFIAPVTAQNLAAYNDYRNYLILFDSGANQQVEHNKVQSFKVGGNMVAWVDYLQNFKLYYKGETKILQPVPIGNYYATDYLIAYTLGFGTAVFVVDGGKERRLTVNSKYFSVGDSIVTFYDMQTQSYKAYYKGKITELDYGDDSRKDEKVSDNVAAYISRTGELRAFWNGQVYPLLLINEPVTYQVGKNIVPYIDGYTSTFKTFYKGNTFEIEPNKPLSFKTGDDLVAYETQDWTFNVFYNQRVTKLSSYQPKFYDVVDSLVIYQEFNTFKVFYKGKIHTLETNFIPTKYSADFSTLVYFDVQNRLTIFQNGEKKVITYEPITSYTLYRNAIHYMVNNTNFIYWKGKSY